VTRAVARSIDRPIPEWQEAIAFLRHTSQTDLSQAFARIVELRAFGNVHPSRIARNHLNPLWEHATRMHTTLSDGSEEVALDA